MKKTILRSAACVAVAVGALVATGGAAEAAGSKPKRPAAKDACAALQASCTDVPEMSFKGIRW